jgi:hypothetical protein
MESIIRRKYENGELVCYVACLDDDSDFIIGFAAFGTDYTLHYAFVKEAFKRLGVCKQLLNYFYKTRKKITVSHWNKKNMDFISKMYEIEYNRFKFFN